MAATSMHSRGNSSTLTAGELGGVRHARIVICADNSGFADLNRTTYATIKRVFHGRRFVPEPSWK